LDQMRRMQISASGVSECAVHSTLEKTSDSVRVWFNTTGATTEGGLARFCWSKPDFANGCDGGPVRSWDVLQQALFAQHPGLHATGLDAFDKTHGVAGNRNVVAQSASPTATDTVILLNISLSIPRSE